MIIFMVAFGFSITGNTRTVLVQELITIAVYVIYITYIILYLKLDIVFVWTAELVYSLTLLLLYYRYMKRGKWQERKIRFANEIEYVDVMSNPNLHITGRFASRSLLFTTFSGGCCRPAGQK